MRYLSRGNTVHGHTHLKSTSPDLLYIKGVLKTLQNSQETTSAGVSFLIFLFLDISATFV